MTASLFPKVFFSKKSDEWATPRGLFRELDLEFGFTIDVCARHNNTKCDRFYTPEQNGLEQNWTGETAWMNPPYSQCGIWMRKALIESRLGCTVVALVPSRTDTAWWHDYVEGQEVRFIKGRVRFVGATAGAPFPSAIVVFRPGSDA